MNKLIYALLLTATFASANAQIMNNLNTNKSFAHIEELNLSQEWDKTFPLSDKVDHRKVTFVNRYGITLAADMYTPKSGNAPFWKNRSRLGQRAGAGWDTFDDAKLMIFSHTVTFQLKSYC